MAPYMNDTVDQPYGDWRDEFHEKGYVVLKGVIPKDRALNYRNKMMDWLGSFDNDFDIKNPSTWTKENLPQSFKNGMYLNYCAAHEKYVWEARQYVDMFRSLQEYLLIRNTESLAFWRLLRSCGVPMS
jgi:hypothetical protein